MLLTCMKDKASMWSLFCPVHFLSLTMHILRSSANSAFHFSTQLLSRKPSFRHFMCYLFCEASLVSWTRLVLPTWFLVVVIMMMTMKMVVMMEKMLLICHSSHVHFQILCNFLIYFIFTILIGGCPNYSIP